MNLSFRNLDDLRRSASRAPAGGPACRAVASGADRNPPASGAQRIPAAAATWCEKFDLAQSTVSQHLKVLVEAGLVKFAPDRQRSRYEIDREALAGLVGFGRDARQFLLRRPLIDRKQEHWPPRPFPAIPARPSRPCDTSGPICGRRTGRTSGRALVWATVLLVVAKLVLVAVPYFFKWATDALAGDARRRRRRCPTSCSRR